VSDRLNRANAAAATVEGIADEWPAVVERLEQSETLSRKAALNAQVAGQKADASVRAQDELERRRGRARHHRQEGRLMPYSADHTGFGSVRRR
jgi:hypothetical protein